MNLEQLEYQITLLDGKSVVVIQPHSGKVSIAYTGQLQVTNNGEGLVGFHLVTPLNEAALSFFAPDVVSLEQPQQKNIEKIIRLKGPHQYNEQYVPTI